ncbi:hypothetical protein AYM02_08615 [Coxiella burnetii]|nr:hypothetical protein AUR58_09390 [Coxiella burnetii]AML55282.1 hypothetical protein AYM38_08510 [Coxiella burnetii]ATN69260.1 hypothetical protein AYM00_08950 [Coxiella burnetii]ATN71177.1 hypothetical protein AYM02_08615 [Coxiella burnetii]ATN74183.1 hypothetical protein AYM90_03715 [Coxiella burnetii]
MRTRRELVPEGSEAAVRAAYGPHKRARPNSGAVFYPLFKGFFLGGVKSKLLRRIYH